MSKRDNKVVNNFEPSLTKQSFKDDCDINKMIARYKTYGQPITHVNHNTPRYIDCVGVPEYHEAVAIIEAAEASFTALPAKVRARFKNDPSEMLAFCADEKNRQEAIELGLIEPPKQPEKAPAPAPEQAESPTL